MSNIIGNRIGNTIIPYAATTKMTKALNVSSYLAASSYISSLSVTKATAMFYADSNGVWFMDLIAKYTGDLATAPYHVITLSGITFDSTAQYYQPIISIVDDATYAAAGGWLGYVSPGTSSIYVAYGNTVTGENGKPCYINLSGIRLSAEPTWASLGTTAAAAMEGVIAADVWIPPANSTTPGLLSYYEEGTTTLTASGFTTNVTGTAYWIRINNVVHMVIPSFGGTSNSTSFSLSGLPSKLHPVRNQDFVFHYAFDNGVAVYNVIARKNNGDGITLYKAAFDIWANSGSKSIPGFNMSYILT